MTNDIVLSLYEKSIQSAQQAATLVRQCNPKISERLDFYENSALDTEAKGVLVFRCIDGSLYPILEGFYASRTLGAVCDREILRRFLSLVAIKTIIVEVHVNCAWLTQVNSNPDVEGDVEKATRHILSQAENRLGEPGNPLDLSNPVHVDAVGWVMCEEVKRIVKAMSNFKAGSAPKVFYRVAGCKDSCKGAP